MDAPRDDLVRALIAGPELRAASDTGLGTMSGHYSVTNQWTHIRSWYEGDFMERIAPGAATKTIAEHFAAAQPRVKVLYDHGHDPHIGNKVLGSIDALEEDDEGTRFEVGVFDTTYNRDLVPGLVAGVYGSSFRFSVIKDEWNEEPGVSSHNPQGLPERTITEYRLYEFGPVTFPAYAGATAGMRSLTDRYLARTDPARFASAMAKRGIDLSHLTGQEAGDAATPPEPEPREHSVTAPNRAQARARLQLIFQGA